jgi:hypothetical protein
MNKLRAGGLVENTRVLVGDADHVVPETYMRLITKINDQTEVLGAKIEIKNLKIEFGGTMSQPTYTDKPLKPSKGKPGKGRK